MEKTLSPARADRLLRIFKRLVVNMRDAGMSKQLIGDREFQVGCITLDGRNLANFGLCSYLSLGIDDRVKEAAKKAIDRYGTSYSSSIAYTAVPLYGDLKDRMRRIFEAEPVITGTTTLGHLSALPVLIRPDDQVFVDAQTHTSVTTATQVLQASGTSVSPVKHNDLAALEHAITGVDTSRSVWYLTDGVFSMHGDTSPAEEIRSLLDRYPNLHVYCDDAHGFGWAGENGRGQFLERFGWHERVVVIVGLAKAFGSLGGVVATTNREFAEMIDLCGPALTFGGPVPPPNLGASIAAADILLSDELTERQVAIMERIRLVNDVALATGLPLVALDETPLWYLDVGEVGSMLKLLSAMRDAGFYLNGAGFPAVPHGHAGLRFTVTLDNSLRQIEDMLTCLNEKYLEMFGETELEVDLSRTTVRRPSTDEISQSS